MSQPEALLTRFPALTKISSLPKPILLGIASAIIAILVVLVLWSRGPDYGVLFSNLEDRDGGAIVNVLAQMNVPYRFSDNGSAILVPKNRIHETRLQLAGQGLPRAGGVGFELLDNTRFGASQFTEQITYQRALEGELANSIRAVQSIEHARVHLAIPRESLFVRDRQAATASILVTLYPGRSLSAPQVSAITWLVSSSVPNLTADNVSIVDQNGGLLTSPDGQAGGVDASQRNFVNDVEQRTVQRILTLVSPLVGAGNVRAQASADVDFSQREQTSEVYRPNQLPGEGAVRSKQTSDSDQHNMGPPSGVPGALTNQPPAAAIAPIVLPAPDAEGAAADAPEAQAAGGAQTTVAAGPRSSRHDSTINYEVDRTISHLKEPLAKLRRLSVAVVVNYQRDADGEMSPLSSEELDKLERLVKDAMGFSEARGDTISVVNSPFNTASESGVEFWNDPEYRAFAMQLIRYLLLAIALFVLWRKVIRPFIGHLNEQRSTAQMLSPEQKAEAADTAAAARRASEISRYEENLNVARELAEKDPRAVAMVLRSWMEKDGKH